MTYVLDKSLEKNTKLELYSLAGICHLCRDIREELQHCSCNGALKCGAYCRECQLDMQALDKCGCEKTAVYELLRTGMVGGPAHVFTRYHEKGITRIRSHESLLTKGAIGYDAIGDVMPCGKDMLVVNKKPFDQKRIAKFSKNVLKGKVLHKSTLKCLTSLIKFSEMSPLFVVQEIPPDRDIPEEMKIYKEKTGRKRDKEVLGCYEGKKDPFVHAPD